MIYFNGIPIENAIKILQNGTILWECGSDIPDISEYIQDGLVFHLDGINKGDDDTAWTDLIGGRRYVYENCILNDNNVEFNGVDSQALGSNSLSISSSTIESCFFAHQPTKTTKRYATIFFSGPNSSNYPDLQMDIQYGVYKLRSYNKYFPAPTFNKHHSISVSTNLAIYDSYKYRQCNTTASKDYGKPCIGCDTYNKLYDYFEGKIYSIRIYNRVLSNEERAHNQMIDYLRFKLPVDQIKINLTNDRGEAITNALIRINDYSFTYTEPTTYVVPKGTEYSIWFNGVEYNRAPEAIIDQCGSQTINAVYTYTGFQDGFMTEVEVADGQRINYYFTNVTITSTDWGDGTVDTSYSHTYTTGGTYIVKMQGSFKDKWQNNSSYTYPWVKKILQWPVKNLLYSLHFYCTSTAVGKLEYIAPTLTQSSYSYLYISYVPITNCISLNSLYCKDSTTDNISCFSVNKRFDKDEHFCAHYVNVYAASGYTGGCSLQYIREGFSNIAYKINKVIGVANASWNSTDTQIQHTGVNGDESKLKYVEFSTTYLDSFHGKGVIRDFSSFTKWGTESEENRQSLVRSLVNNTVDLFESGLVNEKIKLSSKSLSLLTEEEIAQITSKGYTLT